MPAKQYDPADYAATGFLSIEKRSRVASCGGFIADRLLAGEITGYWGKTL
jgi:hypothetical protein